LLWLIFIHVPVYAQYNVWMCVGFLAFDWGCRIIHAFLRNTHLLSKLSQKTPGYSASTEVLSGNMVRLTLHNVDFTWKAGQHVYISVPTLRPFEVHPFTIANDCINRAPIEERKLTMLIKAHGGFSRSLQKAAMKDAQSARQRRVFLLGPWGIPPDVLHYETVVLIACASGASFIIPMLQNLVAKQGCVQQTHLHWIVRSRACIGWFDEELQAIATAARAARLQLHVNIHITQSSESDSDSDSSPPQSSSQAHTLTLTTDPSTSSSRSASLNAEKDSKTFSPTAHEKEYLPSQTSTRITRFASRPTVESIIRPPVEAALGETAVITCGGAEITAQARTFVARLSDERAVHKGSGAQGIYLFTETYGW
jgi:NAD(P)H-flavin reductase